MNLFAVVCGAPRAMGGAELEHTIADRCRTALIRVSAAYPSLPGDVSESIDLPQLKVATVHHAGAVAGLRVYCARTEGRFLTMDGSLVDNRGELNAHDARDLIRSDDLPDRLEGRFVVLPRRPGRTLGRRPA